MGEQNNEFARLLTEGILAIKMHEHKAISIIQDELGYALGKGTGGTSIGYWRRGYIPANKLDFNNLAREIVRRGKVSLSWLEKLFKQSKFDVAALRAELFGDERMEKTAVSILPNPNFHQPLVGRSSFIDKIIDILTAAREEKIVGVDGQGGIGKTAVAYKIAELCLKKELFETVIWLSADVDALSETLTFEMILDHIGLQTGNPKFAYLAAEEKSSLMHDFLTNNRVLIVLDNLETAKVSQEEIVQNLLPLLGKSRALLTSRRRFLTNVVPISLKGLNIEDSLKLIRQFAKSKQYQHVETAVIDDLTTIATATGGSPLAIQLVVSQLNRLPIHIVLRNLQEIPSLAQIGKEGEYITFYKFVFWHSWNLLMHKSKRLLVTMSQFSTSNGAHFDALHQVSQMDYESLLSSIEELWESSLLEIRTQSGIEQMRYTLHPLTKNFVLSDIAKVQK